MTIYLGSDHGGYELKNHLKYYLEENNYEVEDFGAYSLSPSDDYPDYAYPVAQAVAEDKDGLGILLCRSGQGVCIAANKIEGIRAELAWNEAVAAAGRADDHANILCLPSDYIDKQEAEKIVDAFLNTAPKDEQKYLRRVKKIQAIEEEK